jgi:hypothetical protein
MCLPNTGQQEDHNMRINIADKWLTKRRHTIDTDLAFFSLLVPAAADEAFPFFFFVRRAGASADCVRQSILEPERHKKSTADPDPKQAIRNDRLRVEC